MNWIVRPSRVGGETGVPGDKSISHRALMLAAIAEGQSMISGLATGEDVLSTQRCLSELGVSISLDVRTTRVAGGTLRPPKVMLDAGNSGTTARLLAGLLAAQHFNSAITGDASLKVRPMKRIIEPLERMGACIQSEDGHVPLRIEGRRLHGVEYALPVASAQVKSAILFAGLFAVTPTCVIESIASRDHTERMLEAQGADVTVRNGRIELRPGGGLAPLSFTVPGDMSSAAFLITAAVLTGQEMSIHHVGINPTRMGFLNVLERMGVRIYFDQPHLEAGEPVATVTVSGGVKDAIQVQAEEVPLLIDEIPLVALLATQCQGLSVVSGASELRVKETDRIRAIVTSLSTLGADIVEKPDGFEVRGPVGLVGAQVESLEDHRQAMMLAVAGLAASGVTTVTGTEAAGVSWPQFPEVLVSLGARIDSD